MKNATEQDKLIQDWLTFARENLLYAKAGMKEDFAPYHTICFLCQGSNRSHRSGRENRAIRLEQITRV